MLVKDLMNTKPTTASTNATFIDLWMLIFEKKITGIPILENDKYLVGVVSEEDIIEKLYPSYEDFILDPESRGFSNIADNLKKAAKLKAWELMNKNIYTTSANSPAMKAASSMLIYKVTCLPVVKNVYDKQILEGIICKSDIFSQLFLQNISKQKKGVKAK